jgi:hypothetical protein
MTRQFPEIPLLIKRILHAAHHTSGVNLVRASCPLGAVPIVAAPVFRISFLMRKVSALITCSSTLKTRRFSHG